jgi:hypothetical protein
MRVLEATGIATRPLSELSSETEIGSSELLRTVNALADRDLARVVDTKHGPGLTLTPQGITALK